MDMIPYFKIKKMSPQLLITDINQSIEFYTKKLAFGVDFRYEDCYSGIIKDGYSIHLKLGKPSIEERENRKKMKALTLYFQLTKLKICLSNYLVNHLNSSSP